MQFGRKEIICLTLPGNSPSLREVMAGTQESHDPGGRSRSRGQGIMLPTGLLPTPCWAYFLVLPASIIKQKKIPTGNEEIAQQLRALALPENWNLILNTQIVDCNYMYLQFLFCPLCTDICSIKKHPYTYKKGWGNKENTPQICVQDSLIESFSQMKYPPPGSLSSCQVDKN